MKEDKKFDIDKTIQDLTSRKMGILRKPVEGSEHIIDLSLIHI